MKDWFSASRQQVVVPMCFVQIPISARYLDAVVMATLPASISQRVMPACVMPASGATENIAMVTVHMQFLNFW